MLSIFSFASYLFVFFRKMSILFFYPFFIFFILNVWAIYIFWILTSCISHHLQTFSLFHRMPFHFVGIFLIIFLIKLLNLIRPPCLFFAFIYFALRDGTKNYCCDLCQVVFCFFFPRSFMVSDLTFRSLNHFDFIFVYGMKECSFSLFCM